MLRFKCNCLILNLVQPLIYLSGVWSSFRSEMVWGEFWIQRMFILYVFMIIWLLEIVIFGIINL
jgi:hypothetical protein